MPFFTNASPLRLPAGRNQVEGNFWHSNDMTVRRL
jgi:hypothetical protein